MEVIIIKPTKKIKKIGEIVKVKAGYARNFLLPREFALRATEENKSKFLNLKKELETKYQDQRTHALELISKIKGVVVTFVSQSLEDGKLFGSIGSKQIVRRLNDELKLDLKNEQVHLEAPIKNVGVSEVEIALHHEVAANILVNIARTESEAMAQINNFKNAASQAAKSETIEKTAEATA